MSWLSDRVVWLRAPWTRQSDDEVRLFRIDLNTTAALAELARLRADLEELRRVEAADVAVAVDDVPVDLPPDGTPDPAPQR